MKLSFFGGLFVVRRRRVRCRVPGALQYQKHKESTRALVHARLAYWSAVYPFEYGQVRIKNHRRAWGSCSNKKNLNFNWRLIRIAPELADYVVVHELCHTVYLNHSREFWDFVGRLLPEYRAHRANLRQHGIMSQI